MVRGLTRSSSASSFNVRNTGELGRALVGLLMVYLLPIGFNEMHFDRRTLERTTFDLWASQNVRERAVRSNAQVASRRLCCLFIVRGFMHAVIVNFDKFNVCGFLH